MNSDETAVIGIFKDDERAIIPTIAYEGTSACFDIFAIEDTVIPARGCVMVPNGIRIAVPEGYYIEFADRSGNGIGKNLQIHQGVIDTGYTGELSIKVFNMGDEDQIIKKGKGICQAKVMKIPKFYIYEMNKDEWDEYCEESIRGENGFGSSDNK